MSPPVAVHFATPIENGSSYWSIPLHVNEACSLGLSVTSAGWIATRSNLGGSNNFRASSAFKMKTSSAISTSASIRLSLKCDSLSCPEPSFAA